MAADKRAARLGVLALRFSERFRCSTPEQEAAYTAVPDQTLAASKFQGALPAVARMTDQDHPVQLQPVGRHDLSMVNRGQIQGAMECHSVEHSAVLCAE